MNKQANKVSINFLFEKNELTQKEKEDIFSYINIQKNNESLIIEKLRELDGLISTLNKERKLNLKEKVEFEILNKKLDNNNKENNNNKDNNFSNLEKILTENFQISSTMKNLEGNNNNNNANNFYNKSNEKFRNSSSTEKFEKMPKINFPNNVVISKKDKDEILFLNNKIISLQEELKKKEESTILTVKNIKIKLSNEEKKCEELQLKIKELSNNNKALRNLNEISEKINSSIIKTSRRSERKSIFDLNVINKVEKRESFMRRDSINKEDNDFNSNFNSNNFNSNNNSTFDFNSKENNLFSSNNNNRMSKRSFSMSSINNIRNIGHNNDINSGGGNRLSTIKRLSNFNINGIDNNNNLEGMPLYRSKIYILFI